jgi:hypothetical protein
MTQLSAVTNHHSDLSLTLKIDPLEEISFGKTLRRHVREFATIFAALFIGLGSFKIYQGQSLSSYAMWLALGVVFITLGWCAPRVLLPVWRLWMKFAHYLSILMTAVLLSATWCLAFIPMAGILKALGIKRMDRSFKEGAESYWEKRDPKYDDFKRLKLQY